VRLQEESLSENRDLLRYGIFVLQSRGFRSGPDETRTRDLRHASATKHVLACHGVSENYPILQVFYETGHSVLSIPYAPVPARLQYGCSNFPASWKGKGYNNKSAVYSVG
jgi:hypothetical protein